MPIEVRPRATNIPLEAEPAEARGPAAMRILERSVYRGPHIHGGRPMIRFMIDLGAMEQRPTDTLPGFAEQLVGVLPGLRDHGCSARRPGGLLERLEAGTWLGHVIEHVALELQGVAGSPVTRGKTRSVAGAPGVYHVMYAYSSDTAGLMAGRMAVELVTSLLPRELQGVSGLDILAAPVERAVEDGPAPGLAALRAVVARSALGPTTESIAAAARRRAIPVTRVDEHSLIRLGYGSRQKVLRASITGATSHIAVESAGNKNLAKALLREAGLPVPRGAVVRSADEAAAAASRLRYPVVAKPLNANHGRGVTLDLTGPDQVRAAFATAAAHGGRVLVEEQYGGRDYRVLVVDGRVVAVAERVPASVVGDGTRTIGELIDALNSDPRRGVGHEKVMTRVRADARLHAMLERQGLAIGDVPAAGRSVQLRETANLSTGGESIDRTDEIHVDNIAVAERAARIIGLDIAGLDVLTPDISRPLTETGGGIIEVNAAPGFRMHLQPAAGEPRDVAAPVTDMLYPPGSSSLVPITAVTGTNGKSTTVRMIAHILESQGLTTGVTTTSGIYIGGRRMKAVDASGPKSARAVLADPTVDAAVLETARGGILREGLAYRKADVGIVMNISADHLGIRGVETLADLAAVKSLVVRHVRRKGTSILNGDDPLTRRMAARAGGRVAFFTLRGIDLPPDLRQHIDEGGTVAAFEQAQEGGLLVLHAAGSRTPVMDALDIPATLGGAALFNVQNALAAILAASAHRVPVPAIADALRGFTSTFEQNPGRLNVTRAPGFTTIMDYAHNPAALTALGEVIHRLRPQHDRTIGVVSIPGDRRDDDIREMGAIAAGIFDEIVFRELPDGRGRSSGGVLALLSEGALGAGADPGRLRRVSDEHEATETALRLAAPHDLVVLLPTDIEATWRQIHAFGEHAASVAGREETA